MERTRESKGLDRKRNLEEQRTGKSDKNRDSLEDGRECCLKGREGRQSTSGRERERASESCISHTINRDLFYSSVEFIVHGDSRSRASSWLPASFDTCIITRHVPRIPRGGSVCLWARWKIRMQFTADNTRTATLLVGSDVVTWGEIHCT